MQSSTGQVDDAQVAGDALGVDHLEDATVPDRESTGGTCPRRPRSSGPHLMQTSWSIRALAV